MVEQRAEQAKHGPKVSHTCFLTARLSGDLTSRIVAPWVPSVNGQVEVPAGGQLIVPTPCGCADPLCVFRTVTVSLLRGFLLRLVGAVRFVRWTIADRGVDGLIVFESP